MSWVLPLGTPLSSKDNTELINIVNRDIKHQTNQPTELMVIFSVIEVSME